MSPLERDALPGALLDPLIERLDVYRRLAPYGSTLIGIELLHSISEAITKCREALLMEPAPTTSRAPGQEARLVTINDVSSDRFDTHARALHELLCEADLIRCAAGWSYNGWTKDGRAVRHRIKVEGYERTGPKVENERAALAASPTAPQAPAVRAETSIETYWRQCIVAGPVAIIYTDLINGEQCHRDDLWLATTKQLECVATHSPAVNRAWKRFNEVAASPTAPTGEGAEPVAWLVTMANGEQDYWPVDPATLKLDPRHDDVPSKVEPLYAAPQAATGAPDARAVLATLMESLENNCGRHPVWEKEMEAARKVLADKEGS